MYSPKFRFFADTNHSIPSRTFDSRNPVLISKTRGKFFILLLREWDTYPCDEEIPKFKINRSLIRKSSRLIRDTSIEFPKRCNPL